ncbi:MAG: hypothetical protein WD690_13280 [Vicinamibacterales bacterium]
MTPEQDRRRDIEEQPSPKLNGVPVRDDDIEPTATLHWVAVLFRVMAGLLFLLMVMQVALGLTSAVAISYGVLFAEAVRLLIFAGLLWAVGGLADLFVKSHHDMRATRILLARIAYRLREEAPPVPPADDGDRIAGSDDARYRH